MKTYTFTESELKALLRATLDRFTDQDGVFDFSPDETGKEVAIEETMTYLEPGDDISFDGSPTIYTTEDNISVHELGLQEAM